MENMEGKGRTSQIEEQMADLERVTHTIGDLVEKIEMRLTKVLLAQTDIEAKPHEPQKELVPLAGFIRDQVQFLTAQANGLHDVLSRIEL